MSNGFLAGLTVPSVSYFCHVVTFGKQVNRKSVSSRFQTISVQESVETAEEFMVHLHEDQESRTKLTVKGLPRLAYFVRQTSPSEGSMASSSNSTS